MSTKSRARNRCGRCLGTGAHISGGICFRCSGKGFQNRTDRRRNNHYDANQPISFDVACCGDDEPDAYDDIAVKDETPDMRQLELAGVFDCEVDD